MREGQGCAAVPSFLLTARQQMRIRAVKVAFLDRDGTIIRDHPDADWKHVKTPEFLEGTIEGLQKLANMGFQFIIVSNQYLIADGIITQEDYGTFHAQLLENLSHEGISILASYHCPHNDSAECCCKKPRPGMIELALREHPIDLRQSIYCGDSPCDSLLARQFGLPFFGIGYQGAETDVVRCASLRDVPPLLR